MENILFNIVLILLEQHDTSENAIQCCPRGATTLHKKKPEQCCLNTSGQHFAGKTLRIVVPKARDNIVQKKIQTIICKQHLVTPFIYILGSSSHKKYEDTLPLL